jgi:hypothetical protein
MIGCLLMSDLFGHVYWHGALVPVVFEHGAIVGFPRAHALDATNPDQLSCQQALIVIRDY